MFWIISLAVFILILSFLVFIHELGHFFTAKKFGIKVEEFGMGIPPRAWGKKFGETLYSLNWLPIGGFVKIKGEDMTDFDPKDKHNFQNKKPWQRAIVLVAGVFMNFVFAVAVLYGLLSINGFKSSPIVEMSDYDFKFGKVNYINNVVSGVDPKSNGVNSGIRPGDIIQKLQIGQDVKDVKDINDIKTFLKDKENDEVIVHTVNINTSIAGQYKFKPIYYEQIGQAGLGVSLVRAIQLDYSTNLVDTLFSGFMHSVNIMGYSFDVLGNMIGISFEQKTLEPVSQGVSGPVGIYGAVDAVLSQGGPNMIYTILDLMALLSLSLAFMNLLPLPALDGGRLVFVIFEWITGKRPSQKLESIVHQVGFMLLIGLIIIITFKDVWMMWVG